MDNIVARCPGICAILVARDMEVTIKKIKEIYRAGIQDGFEAGWNAADSLYNAKPLKGVGEIQM